MTAAVVMELERCAGDVECLTQQLILNVDNRSCCLTRTRNIAVSTGVGIGGCGIFGWAKTPIEIPSTEMLDRDPPQAHAGLVKCGQVPQFAFNDTDFG